MACVSSRNVIINGSSILMRSWIWMFGPYFYFKNRTHRSFSFFNHIHQIWAHKMYERFFGSWRPKPPSLFGRHWVSHAMRAHFHFNLGPFQRNFLWIFLTILRMDFGDANAEKRYNGITCRKDFSKMSLDGVFIVLKVQEESLASKDVWGHPIEIFQRVFRSGMTKCSAGRELLWNPSSGQCLTKFARGCWKIKFVIYFHWYRYQKLQQSHLEVWAHPWGLCHSQIGCVRGEDSSYLLQGLLERKSWLHEWCFD